MLSNPSSQRFADEGGTDDKGNKLDYIRNDQGADRQFEYFVPRTHPKRPIATEPVNRGFCVLRSWRTGECSQQYSWKRRASQGGPEGLPRSPGGCNQNAR